jgi:hypothetical protein
MSREIIWLLITCIVTCIVFGHFLNFLGAPMIYDNSGIEVIIFFALANASTILHFNP